MEIDLFTFSAQVANFLILAWLLKRFLFDRVSAVMDERAKRTNALLAAAEDARKTADAEAAQARALREDIEADRKRILAEAMSVAAVRSRAALEEARSMGEGERRAWRADLAARKEGFLASLADGAAIWLGELARKALVDLADEDVETRMIVVLVARLVALDEEAIGDMRASLNREGAKLLVISSFSIKEEGRVRIAEAARRSLSWTGDIEFRVDASEGVGVALVAGGFKVAWGVGEYLRDVDARLRAAFEEAEGIKEAGNG